MAKVNGEYWQVPYKKLDDFVEVLRNEEPWLWTAESSMEIRFMPSLARDQNQIAFIINTENEICQKLRNNSVFKETFNQKYVYEFINNNAKEKFEKEGFVADFFQRADYLIFGLPKNVIEGILVGRILENDNIYLDKLKNYFQIAMFVI